MSPLHSAWLRRVLPMAALLGATWAAAAPARACSEFCGGAVRVPHEPSIPGNLIAFDVLQPELPYSLETDRGEPVAASVRVRGGKPVYEADEPVAPGTALRLHYTDCGAPYSYDFVAGPFAEFEPRPPTLEFAERRVEAPGSDAAVSVVRLRYRGPDPQNVAPHLVQAIASVDGLNLPLTRSDDGWLIELRSACDGGALEYGPVCARASTPAGVYTVEVNTHVVGADVDIEPLTLEVDTSCPNDEVGSHDDDHGDAAGCALLAPIESRAPLLLAAIAGVLSYRRRR